MHTLKLKVNDRVYEKFIWLLSKFSKDEVEIIPEDTDFKKNQTYLATEFDEILQGKANFIEMNEAEQRLEKVVARHENSI
jgi:hypothetical protein